MNKNGTSIVQLQTSASEKYQQGDLTGAVELYYQAISLDANQPDWVYGNIVTILSNQGNFAAALKLGHQALKLHPKSDEIYRSVGIVFMNQDDQLRCIDCYKKAIAINPEQPKWLYLKLATYLINQKRNSEALEIAQKRLANHPEEQELIELFNTPTESVIQENEEIKHSQEVKDFTSLHNQAVTKHKEGNLTEAVEHYLQAIEIDKHQPAWIYGNVISLLSQLKRFEQAINLGNQALEFYPESDEIYRAIALNYENQDDTINSIKNYQQALALKTQQPDWLYCNLAKRLLQTKDIVQAIFISQQGTKFYPNVYYLHYILGRALATNQQWNEAILSYRHAQELKPDFEELQEHLNIAVYQQSKSQRNQPQALTNNVSSPQYQENIIEDTLKFDEVFSKIIQEESHLVSWQKLPRHISEITYGCWLSPNIVYFEINILDNLIINQVDILTYSKSKYDLGKGQLFAINPQKIGVIACFPENLYLENYDNYYLSLKLHEQIIISSNSISQKAFNLEIIEHLKTKSDLQKQLIRENINHFLITSTPQKFKQENIAIVNKLQYFLATQPINYIDPDLPFKFYLDYLIPLKCDGLFISGWLQDPYNMLEEITAISDLGFSLKFSNQDIYRLERRDVNEFLKNTRYGNFQEDLGFCAYTKVPQAVQNSIKDFGELHGFRFLVKLKGNIEIPIVPDVKYSDYYLARKQVLQITEPDKMSESMLNNCLKPTLLKLQQLCIEQVKIKDITVIGKPPEKPLISIIIPLYRRLDFLKVQFATIANDPASKQYEIIYVLDSPEQEAELRNFLSHHCALYQLPVTLVIMECNSGYAAANNAGAAVAKGSYLVLLNSDVFPKTQSWAMKMVDFYKNSPQIGTLGAKLIYEDYSLQHAGMFFAQTTFPFWVTLHYYKGLPYNYQPAQITRPVPAVTGACLMIKRELYDEVGGLSTDYVIGDFEDSDLCLKCSELGYESWYFADVTLYHFERQSVPLNTSYNGSLAWHLNGRLHQARWGERIEKLMRIYP